jgi:hypothetical protein
MPHVKTKRTESTATVAVVLVLASLLLAACGSSSTSSSSTSTTAGASASTSTPTTPSTTARAKAPGAGRFTALRECLQKNGITLPKRTPGQQRPPGAGGFLGGAGGGTELPKGMTRTQYQAALKKCGAAAFAGRSGRASNPVFRQALAKFVACMRENGIKLPEPNTSGKGPVFNTSAVNTTGTKFKAAEAKCAASLRGAFRGAPGAGARPGAAPPG